MIYLTAGMSFRAGTGSMPTADALALQALLQAGGAYTATMHNLDGSNYTA